MLGFGHAAAIPFPGCPDLGVDVGGAGRKDVRVQPFASIYGEGHARDMAFLLVVADGTGSRDGQEPSDFRDGLVGGFLGGAHEEGGGLRGTGRALFAVFIGQCLQVRRNFPIREVIAYPFLNGLVTEHRSEEGFLEDGEFQ